MTMRSCGSGDGGDRPTVITGCGEAVPRVLPSDTGLLDGSETSLPDIEEKNVRRKNKESYKN